MSFTDIDSIIDQIVILNNQSHPDIKRLEFLQNQLHNINVQNRNLLKIMNTTQDILSFNPTIERMKTNRKS